jgi:hypothetical protein
MLIDSHSVIPIGDPIRGVHHRPEGRGNATHGAERRGRDHCRRSQHEHAENRCRPADEAKSLGNERRDREDARHGEREQHERGYRHPSKEPAAHAAVEDKSTGSRRPRLAGRPPRRPAAAAGIARHASANL